MQSTIRIEANQLRNLNSPYLQWQAGNPSAMAHSVGTPESLTQNQLAFVSKIDFIPIAFAQATILVVDQTLLKHCPPLRADQALFSTSTVKAAMVVSLHMFDPRSLVNDPLHAPTATLHPTSKVGSTTRLDPGVCIGPFVKIGENCHLHANVVVEAGCEIGDHVTIHANSTIGSDGFGFATGPDGRHYKVPQIGRVVIESHVEIGANCAIDRGTIGVTRICQGTKLDNHIHIAHNCELGANGLYAAGFMTAGSTQIGAHFMCGGGVAIADHIKICDQVTLGGRSSVTKNIQSPGAYTGFPLEPLKDGLRTLQNLTKVTSMRRQITKISKKLGLNEELS